MVPKPGRKTAASSFQSSAPNTKLSIAFVFQIINVWHTIEVALKEEMKVPKPEYAVEFKELVVTRVNNRMTAANK